MKRLGSLTGLLVIVALLMFAGPAAPKSVLVDESHGQLIYDYSLASSAVFSTARTALNNAGHTLSALSGSPGAITAAALAPYDVFWTGTLQQPYLTSEITALQGFVAGGGCVVVVHDGGYSSDSATPSVNTFLAPYGMQMAAATTYPTGVVVSDFVPHCLTANVQTFGVDYVRELSSITAPAVDLTPGTVELLAAYENGGEVIVLGDESCFNDGTSPSDYPITYGDNETMLLNLIGCCGPANPVEDATWGTIKAMYR
jgi:hypothetical protein